MKYVMSWTSRLNGSEKENEEAMRRGVEMFSKWQPPDGTTFHQFVGSAELFRLAKATHTSSATSNSIQAANSMLLVTPSSCAI